MTVSSIEHNGTFPTLNLPILTNDNLALADGVYQNMPIFMADQMASAFSQFGIEDGDFDILDDETGLVQLTLEEVEKLVGIDMMNQQLNGTSRRISFGNCDYGKDFYYDADGNGEYETYFRFVDGVLREQRYSEFDNVDHDASDNYEGLSYEIGFDSSGIAECASIYDLSTGDGLDYESSEDVKFLSITDGDLEYPDNYIGYGNTDCYSLYYDENGKLTNAAFEHYMTSDNVCIIGTNKS